MAKKTSGAVILVLDDGETWDSNGFVRVIADGAPYPEDGADDIPAEHVVVDIPLDDLLQAYNKVHGTDY